MVLKEQCSNSAKVVIKIIAIITNNLILDNWVVVDNKEIISFDII